jgi:hypothetical protein
MTENEIGKIIVNCAIQIHKELGPGFGEAWDFLNPEWSRRIEHFVLL